MKHFLLVIILGLSINTWSQQVWGHQGATWHYEHSLFYLDMVEYSYEGDTVLNNTPAQKIRQVIIPYFQQPDGTIEEGTPNTSWGFTSYSGDSVFWWIDNAFFLLYDFGASIGDTWVIHNSYGMDPSCDTLSKVVVTDTGHVTVNSQSLRYVDIAMLGIPQFGLEGRAVERLGMVSGADASSLFPSQRVCDTNSVVDYNFTYFICYEDNNFPLYNPANITCDYYASVAGLEALEQQEKTVVKVFDLLGREVPLESNKLLVVLYSDGTTEKVFVTN